MKGSESYATRFRYREALDRLVAVQKSGAGVPAYLRWVNRGVGRRLAALAYVLRLTPNQVTLISGATSAVGIIVIAFSPPTPALTTAGVVALLVGYGLDSADGQLARLTGGGCRAGEYLDHVVDAIRLPAVHLAVAASLYRRGGVGESDWPVLVALGFATLSSVWFFGQILADKLTPPGSLAPGAEAPAWVSFAKMPYDVGTLYLVLLTLPVMRLFLVVYTALAIVTLVVSVASLWRKYDALAKQ